MCENYWDTVLNKSKKRKKKQANKQKRFAIDVISDLFLRPGSF